MPVYNTTSSFKQIRDEAEDIFDNSSPAAALVYHGGSPQDFIGIRVECPGISKEFVSNIAFGRDPEGTLYYKDTNELKGECRYEVFFKVGSVLSILIYSANSTGPVAQFVGKDPASAISWLSFDVNHPEVATKGTWLDYTPAEITSKITCRAGDSTVTLSLTSLRKKATFTMPSPSPKGMDHSGTTTLKSVANIPNGTRSIVDFDADRVLFYPRVGDTEMTAYFIPRVNKKEDLQALSGNAFISNGAIAVWSDI